MPRKQYEYHYIYKTVNVINEKYYIGLHSTNNLDDGYTGSGTMLWYAIKKYGKENFITQILEFLPDRNSLLKRESEIITKDVVNDPVCMNLKLGGQNSPGTLGSKYSEESKKKMSEWARPKELCKKISKALTGKKLSKEHCDNISKGKTGKKLSEEHKQNILNVIQSDEYRKKVSESLKGRKLSDETKQKMSKSKKGVPLSESLKSKLRKPKSIIQCPHCDKLGGSSQMKRWHFDNCKLNNMTEIERITIHTDSMVKGFFGDYRWLSNYHVSPVVYEGIEYQSSEAAYQSAKCDDPYIKSQFKDMTPLESKSFSKRIPVKKNWDTIKKQIMYDILVSKFTLTPELKEMLLATAPKYLEETNYWNDTYWGVCEGRGKNILGELLMKIRNELNRH